jgi:hypothetical protein
MEDFKHKQPEQFNSSFKKDPLDSEITKEGYDYNSALEIVEQQKGKVDKTARNKDGDRVEKVMNVLIERSIRWCIRNYYGAWVPNLQIMRKKIDRNEKLLKEDFVLLKTMSSMLQPHKINEFGQKNYNYNPVELYKMYLQKINEKYKIW